MMLVTVNIVNKATVNIEIKPVLVNNYFLGYSFASSRGS